MKERSVPFLINSMLCLWLLNLGMAIRELGIGSDERLAVKIMLQFRTHINGLR